MARTHRLRPTTLSTVLRSLALLLGSGALLAGPLAAQSPAEDTYAFFQQNCTSCHTIGGGKLAGPDLAHVADRQERDWLERFIVDPKAVIDSGDAYAQKLFADARGVYMTPAPGMTRAKAGKLLDLIEYESAQEASRFKGLVIDERPLTAEDIRIGRELYLGERSFASGAPSCFSCHDLEGSPSLGGGRLGPDLTAVYSRLEGRKALSAWLSAPPSEVMAPIYRAQPIASDEILALTAYLRHTAETGLEQAESGALGFLLAGFGLAAAVLVLFDVVWRNRYRATRKPLVEGVTS